MRLRVWAANHAYPVIIAAFVAGCSSSQTSQTLPPLTAPNGGSQRAADNRGTSIALWVTSTSQGYIYGQDARGKRTVATIDAGANGCGRPTGIKVDHKQNLWVACASGSVQKYPPVSSLPSATYDDFYSSGNDQRPMHPPKGGGWHCEFSGNPTDVAFDSRGHVFAANASSGGECGGSLTQPDIIIPFDGPIVWWNARSPKKVYLSISTQEETAAYDLDVDNAGNLYFDGGYGCQQPCEPGVFELSDPTSSSGVLTALTPPTRDQLGGVYVSNDGSVLNVVDETARTISQYELPWIANETPFKILGPTLTRMGEGEPTSGGFDRGEKHLAIGDVDGWIDIGNVASNRWSAVGNENLKHGNLGAAYVPSDK